MLAMAALMLLLPMIGTAQTIKVSGDHALNPQSECLNGIMTGTAVDKVTSALNRECLNATAVCTGLWPDTLKSLENNSIDVVAAMFYTGERAKIFDFFGPVGEDDIGCFMRENGAQKITGIEDIFGLRVVTTEGDSWGKEIDDLIRNGTLKAMKVKTPKDAFLMVKEGTADCALYSLPSGSAVMAQNNLTGLKPTIPLEKQYFYVAVSKKSPCAKDIAGALKKSGYPRFNGQLP